MDAEDDIRDELAYRGREGDATLTELDVDHIVQECCTRISDDRRKEE